MIGYFHIPDFGDYEPVIESAKDTVSARRLVCSIGSGNAPEHKTFRDGIASQTAGAMNAAHNLACGIETAYRLIGANAQNLRLRINANAPHAMMNLGNQADGVIRGMRHRG